MNFDNKRKKLLSALTLIFILAFCLITMGCGEKNDSSQSKSSSGSQSVNTQVKETKAEPVAPVKPKVAEWNKSDVDAATNGNLIVAINELKKKDNIAAEAISINPANVIKTPWDYYGQIISVSGYVALVEPQPPTGDIGQVFGGDVYDIVIVQENDDTIVEGFIKGRTQVSVGDHVTLYGYPIGRTEVPNKLGGSFTHLIIVGK